MTTMIGFNSAVSGMHAAERRVDVAAANIVNAPDTVPHRKAPVRPVGSTSAPAETGDGLYQPVDVQQSTAEGGGTKAQTVERDPDRVTQYQPDTPRADGQGLVDAPRIDIANELVNTILAQQAYEAALKVARTQDQMGAALDAKS
jgi:flagellar basal body rod protein FlgC